MSFVTSGGAVSVSDSDAGISLVTACSAGEVPGLRKTLESIVSQADVPWSWNVVIEGSIDIPEFLRAEGVYTISIGDPVGTSAAKNLGLVHSPYSLVRTLSPGDYFNHHDILNREYHLFHQNQHVNALLPREASFQEDGILTEATIFTGGELPVKFVQKRWYCAESRFGFLARRTDMLNAGGFPSLPGCEDLLMLNLLNRDSPIYAVSNFRSIIRGKPGYQSLPEVSSSHLGKLITAVQ